MTGAGRAHSESLPTEYANRKAFFMAGGLLLCVLGLSLASGYHSNGYFQTPAGRQLLFDFTPLGLWYGSELPLALVPGPHFAFGPPAWSLDYFRVFITTCLWELPLYALALVGLGGIRWPRMIATLFVANFLTHPAIFFVIPSLFSRYLSGLLVSEAFAATVEMILLYALAAKNKGISACLAGLANLLSWQIG